MKKIDVKIYSETGIIPEYKTTGSAGFDFKALVKSDHELYLSKETIENIFDVMNDNFEKQEMNYELLKEYFDKHIYKSFEGFTKEVDIEEGIIKPMIKVLIERYYSNIISANGIILIPPYAYTIIPTGIRMEIPEGYELQVRPRSSINAKTLISIKYGTVDSDYRGDIGIIIQNKSIAPYIIENGDRLAQGIFTEIPQANFVQVSIPEELSSTKRGEGGFGSTGIK